MNVFKGKADFEKQIKVSSLFSFLYIVILLALCIPYKRSDPDTAASNIV